jgi:hypothetical protein
MGISAKRLGRAALVGVCIFGLGMTASDAQMIGGGFHAPGAPNAPAGAGQRAMPTPVAPTPTGSPFGTLMTSPYGASPVPAGSMTSTPYGPDAGAAGATPYGAYILPDPYGGYLKGAADVINANGKYLIQTQQAYQIKEQTRSDRTPTGEEERNRAQQQRLIHALNDPLVTEIWNGQTLNELLTRARQLQTTAGSRQLPLVPVDQAILARLSVTSGKGNSSSALLKNDGNLTWPTGLRDLVPEAESARLRKQAQTYFKKAYEETKAGGHPGAGTLREFRSTVDQLQALVKQNSLDMTTTVYGEARRYLEDLRKAATVLDGVDAGDVLANGLRPQGGNVAEVVQFMSNKGLLFAPAGPGEESAYTAMQRMLAVYIQSTANMLAQQ